MKLIYSLTIIIFSASIYGLDINLKIQSNSGYVTGYIKGGVINWDDIPYAKPPIGDLRWRAPRKLDTSARQNIIKPKDKNFCIQEPSGLGGTEGKNFYTGTEDCLYLDIKTPKNYEGKLLPVMFWIHGGGNTSGLKDLYDFTDMVKDHDVIVVTINYRLGPFGWFTHPSIQELQNGLDKTSNFGT